MENSHRGPNPFYLAIVFMVLFCTGLSFVISFSTGPHFPGPWEPIETILSYFKNQSADVLWCAFFQFGSAIPIGLYTAAMVSRLQFHGIKATGVYIALFGGTMLSVNLAVSSLTLWTISLPVISSNDGLISMLYYFGFAVGGVGYSVPLGILIAGIAMTGGLSGLLPRWVMWTGIGLAVIGEASFLMLRFPNLLFLIPLTRFPGFVWLIIAGTKLPAKRKD